MTDLPEYAVNSLAIAARRALVRQGYTFDWVRVATGDECNLCDDDGRSVNSWTGTAYSATDKERVEYALAVEHLREIRAIT